jgi:hypothetical protein
MRMATLERRGQTTSETVNTPHLPYIVSFVGWSSRHWVRLTPDMRREAAVTAVTTVLIGAILSGKDATQCNKVFYTVIPCSLVPAYQRFRGKQLGSIKLLCSWTFKTHEVSETGLCLRLQVDLTQLDQSDRASPCLRTPTGTSSIDWGQLSRLGLKMETESSLRNFVLKKTGRWIMSRITIIALIYHLHNILDLS